MSDVRGWISRRSPDPPEALARWLDDLPLDPEASRTHALASAALGQLDHARSAPGRVRESAFHLLAADALLTYACESAMDDPDPVRVLEGLVRNAAADER
ncbi:MAG: hypothetical protein PVJ02_12260 [Gemmatimonadota bacterium]